MISLIKGIIWLAGLCVVACFILGYFGYEPNWNYFSQTKATCEEKLAECTSNAIHQGIDNVQCNFNCVDPQLIIKKK